MVNEPIPNITIFNAPFALGRTAMPIILVVDDFAMDRLRVGRLLEKEEALDWVVEYAENGTEALAYMAELVPDVVVTDLMMPGMDGLELVDATHAKYPEVPVILTTAQGSEELALSALERGAASYVPKSELAEKLVDTVKQVLDVARADRRYDQLRTCIRESQIALELDNDPELIAPLVNLLQQMLTNMQFCDSTERIHLGVALEEALLNAYYHGTLALSVEQALAARAEWSRGKRSQFVEARRVLTPYRDRTIFVEASINRKEARFVIRDQGAGFGRTAIPRRHDPTTLHRGAGRGLVLMQNFMDEVSFNDPGNEVTMVKRRPREPRAALSVDE
jgi:CheY-like chemotaxis protein